MNFTYLDLREAILELYLSVKIRSDEEIDKYNSQMFRKEKLEMKQVDGYDLVDKIKGAIEVLMNMKIEEPSQSQSPSIDQSSPRADRFFNASKFKRTKEDFVPTVKKERDSMAKNPLESGDRALFE